MTKRRINLFYFKSTNIIFHNDKAKFIINAQRETVNSMSRFWLTYKFKCRPVHVHTYYNFSYVALILENVKIKTAKITRHFDEHTNNCLPVAE